MSQKPVYVASDVHLGAAPPSREAAFLSWLERTPDHASQVVLNGDLFDFWFEFRRGIPAGHDRALAVLREVIQAGVPVLLMGGNHDWWGGRFLTDEVGVEFLQEPVERTFAGLRAFVAHGDGLGRGDLGYRALRLVLRGRATRFAFGLLGPSLGSWAARRVSKTRTRWEGSTTQDRARAAALEAWAKAQLVARSDLDLVILGHTHIPRLAEVAPGRWYLNAGDWVLHSTYGVLVEGAPPALLTWEG